NLSGRCGRNGFLHPALDIRHVVCGVAGRSHIALHLLERRTAPDEGAPVRLAEYSRRKLATLRMTILVSGGTHAIERIEQEQLPRGPESQRGSHARTTFPHSALDERSGDLVDLDVSDRRTNCRHPSRRGHRVPQNPSEDVKCGAVEVRITKPQ